MDERQGPADESASGGGTGGSSGSSGGPADESAPKGVPPQSPPARAGIEPPWTEGLDSAHSGATLGVVLAGGLSRRMGDLGAKAALAIGGEHLLARVARRLRAAGLRDVLVVGPSELGALVPGVPVVADRRPGTHGPLAGLETALAWASAASTERADLTPDAARHPLSPRERGTGGEVRGEGERGTGGEVDPNAPYLRVFVVACDMPFVAPALVRAMVERAARTPEAEALVLRSATGTEQLHAVYSLSCLPVATFLLDSGARSLRELLTRVRTVEYLAAEAARDDPAGLSAFNANTPDDWRRALELAAAEEE